jgi:hypothetical protein
MSVRVQYPCEKKEEDCSMNFRMLQFQTEKAIHAAVNQFRSTKKNQTKTLEYFLKYNWIKLVLGLNIPLKNALDSLNRQLEFKVSVCSISELQCVNVNV